MGCNFSLWHKWGKWEDLEPIKIPDKDAWGVPKNGWVKIVQKRSCEICGITNTRSEKQ